MTCGYRSASSPPNLELNPTRKREVGWTGVSGPRGLTPIR